jgi:hypothetical protein
MTRTMDNWINRVQRISILLPKIKIKEPGLHQPETPIRTCGSPTMAADVADRTYFPSNRRVPGKDRESTNAVNVLRAFNCLLRSLPRFATH